MIYAPHCVRCKVIASKALLEDFDGIFAAAPQASHYLKRIAENSVRLDGMIADVLTFSRLARADLKLERISLDRLVKELVQQYPSMQPPLAQIRIEPLADVFGHEPSLVQVISNLLINAIKFVLLHRMSHQPFASGRKIARAKSDFGLKTMASESTQNIIIAFSACSNASTPPSILRELESAWRSFGRRPNACEAKLE